MKTNTLQTVIAAARAGARKAWLARLTDDYILLHARAEMIAKAKARAEKLHVRRVKGVGHAARTIGPEWFPGEAVSERTAINRFGKLGYRSFYYVDAADRKSVV